MYAHINIFFTFVSCYCPHPFHIWYTLKRLMLILILCHSIVPIHGFLADSGSALCGLSLLISKCKYSEKYKYIYIMYLYFSEYLHIWQIKKTITLIIKYNYSCVCTKLLSNKWIQLSKSSPALNGGAYFSAGLDLDNCIIITKNVCSCQRGKTSKKIMLLKNIQILWIVWRLVLEVFLVGKSAMLAFIY